MSAYGPKDQGIYGLVLAGAALEVGIDLDSGAKNNGAYVQLWKYDSNNPSPNMQWRFHKQDEGGDSGNLWKIQNVTSGTYINMTDGNKEWRTQITGWQDADSDNLRWYMEFGWAYVGANQIKTWGIKNKSTGAYLNVEGGNLRNGTKIQSWAYDQNGRWQLIPISGDW